MSFICAGIVTCLSLGGLCLVVFFPPTLLCHVYFHIEIEYHTVVLLFIFKKRVIFEASESTL